MKFIKILVLGTVLALGACTTMPHDPDADLDTMNKKMLVVGQEVEAVIKTANDLYLAGLLPKGSKEFQAVDEFVRKLNEAYFDLRAASNLAEFNVLEADLRKTLFSLRKLLLTIQSRGEYNGGERTQVAGYGHYWAYP